MDDLTARRRLSDHGWLALMPADFRTAILDIAQWKRFAARQPLYAAGDGPGGMFGIASGSISYVAALGRADSPPIHVGKAVIWAGEGPLISGQSRRASIVAEEPVVAAYLPLAPLEALLARNPAWWRHIAQQLLMDFDIITNSVNDLMIRSATQRCAATLLRLADQRFASETGTAMPEIQMTRETLAQMTNLSRGSITTIVGDLNQRGLISLGYRAIQLIDVDRLRAIADGD